VLEHKGLGFIAHPRESEFLVDLSSSFAVFSLLVKIFWPIIVICANNTEMQLFRPCLLPSKIFQDSPSYRIFRRMHGVLNINKNKN